MAKITVMMLVIVMLTVEMGLVVARPPAGRLVDSVDASGARAKRAARGDQPLNIIRRAAPAENIQ